MELDRVVFRFVKIWEEMYALFLFFRKDHTRYMCALSLARWGWGRGSSWPLTTPQCPVAQRHSDLFWKLEAARSTVSPSRPLPGQKRLDGLHEVFSVFLLPWRRDEASWPWLFVDVLMPTDFQQLSVGSLKPAHVVPCSHSWDRAVSHYDEWIGGLQEGSFSGLVHHSTPISAFVYSKTPSFYHHSSADVLPPVILSGSLSFATCSNPSSCWDSLPRPVSGLFQLWTSHRLPWKPWSDHFLSLFVVGNLRTDCREMFISLFSLCKHISCQKKLLSFSELSTFPKKCFCFLLL